MTFMHNYDMHHEHVQVPYNLFKANMRGTDGWLIESSDPYSCSTLVVGRRVDGRNIADDVEKSASDNVL